MNQAERRLLQVFKGLSETHKTSLLDYAEFLQARVGNAAEVSLPTEPLDIPRPSDESVIKAIKRLRATYPMLDRSRGDTLLNETSALMTQHVMHRRSAVEIIDELELVFRRHYEARNDNSGNG